MNWLSFDFRALVGCVVGACIGFSFYGFLGMRQMEPPAIVGLCAGLGCAIFTKERSGMRGVAIACIAIWIAALAQVYYFPTATDGILVSLVEFHETLSWGRAVGFALCGILAFLLGATSFNPDARVRLGGT